MSTKVVPADVCMPYAEYNDQVAFSSVTEEMFPSEINSQTLYALSVTSISTADQSILTVKGFTHNWTFTPSDYGFNTMLFTRATFTYSLYTSVLYYEIYIYDENNNGSYFNMGGSLASPTIILDLKTLYGAKISRIDFAMVYKPTAGGTTCTFRPTSLTVGEYHETRAAISTVIFPIDQSYQIKEYFGFNTITGIKFDISVRKGFYLNTLIAFPGKINIFTSYDQVTWTQRYVVNTFVDIDTFFSIVSGLDITKTTFYVKVVFTVTGSNTCDYLKVKVNTVAITGDINLDNYTNNNEIGLSPIVTDNYFLKTYVNENYMLNSLVELNYMLKSIVASDYTKNSDFELLYMLKSIVASDYISRELVEIEYILRTEATPNSVVTSDYIRRTIVDAYYKLMGPQNTEATDGIYTSQIKFSWTRTLETDKYKIYRRVSGAPMFVEIAEVLDTSPSEYIDSDPELSPSVKYEYAVRSVYSFGETSELSEPDAGCVSASTLGKVLNVKASYGIFDDKVELNWSAVPLANEYHVFRRLNSGGTLVEVGSTTETSFVDTSAVKGVLYLYFISAFSESLGWSDMSDPDTGYTGVILGNVDAKTSSMTTYSMFTDETDQEIIFAFGKDITEFDVIEVTAINTTTNQEIAAIETNVKKIHKNVVAWSTSNMPFKPAEPINILLRAEIVGTGKYSSAILQYKKRVTGTEVYKNISAAGPLGRVIY